MSLQLLPARFQPQSPNPTTSQALRSPPHPTNPPYLPQGRVGQSPLASPGAVLDVAGGGEGEEAEEGEGQRRLGHGRGCLRRCQALRGRRLPCASGPRAVPAAIYAPDPPSLPEGEEEKEEGGLVLLCFLFFFLIFFPVFPNLIQVNP